MRVLVVEDDEFCRRVVETTLGNDGVEVTSVSTGAEALALLENGARPDLLLTDVYLPGDVDGWLLARLFRDEMPGLPIVYITASEGGEYHVSNSIYLLRPLRPSLLSQVIAALAVERRVRSRTRLH